MTGLNFMVFHPIAETIYESPRPNGRNYLVPATLNHQCWDIDPSMLL